jgi:hypothetical protein
MIRGVSSLAMLATLSATLAFANDPCPTCGNGVANPGPSKPTCDYKIYPLSELHYIRRYCKPVISPNATYGYFPTQWRAWDGNQTAAAGCAPTSASVIETPVMDSKPMEVKPEAKPEVKPETKTADPKLPDAKPMTPEKSPSMPKPMIPPAVPGKEEAPKPMKKDTSIQLPSGHLTPAQPLSPGVYLVPATK